MNDFSLVEKLNILVNIIASSPLFLFCSMLGVAVLILFILDIKKEKKINKLIFVFIWLLLGIILIINYNSIILNLIDNVFDSIFMALYFPSLTVYVSIVFISNFSFFYTLLNKNINQKNRIINFTNALIINTLLIFVIDTVKSNEINIYDQVTMYTNSNLLVLLELTSSIFVSWCLLGMLISAHNKLKKYDNKELPEMPEIVFDDI